MSSTVDALLPLSFLEAVRDIDAPDDDVDAEFVQELRNKRFGLSDTVFQQIRRYSDAVRRNQRTARDEAVALARLIGRRPDAEAVFRVAGRFLAREAYDTIAPLRRRMMLAFPAMLARPIALRHARRIARRYFNGSLSRSGAMLLLEVRESVTLGTTSGPRSTGCAYYEAGLRELLRLLVNGGGAVEHVRCMARGDELCAWRAEWRALR
jgi:predicted hydrocarbon binding protein